MSAGDVADTLAMSPDQEQLHFERRDRFDLIVYYDQDTKSLPQGPSEYMKLTALASLRRALVEFNFQRELRHSPKLLVGGVEAWMDLMGPNSLQTSSTSGSVRQTPAPAWPVRRTSDATRPKPKFRVSSMKPEEVPAWEATLKNIDEEMAQSPGFVRTTEDFLRRFPAVSLEQESMTSPVVSPPTAPPPPVPQAVDFYRDLPSPPTRPAPAVPRPSYSGLAHSADDDGLADDSRPPVLARKATVVEQPQGEYWTGLHNPHNWCYANSSLQILRASPGFGAELSGGEWSDLYKVPRKTEEKIDHPQLMTRIMANLFQWMATGKFQNMKAQTIMVSPPLRITRLATADI